MLFNPTTITHASASQAPARRIRRAHRRLRGRARKLRESRPKFADRNQPQVLCKSHTPSLLSLQPQNPGSRFPPSRPHSPASAMLARCVASSSMRAARLASRRAMSVRVERDTLGDVEVPSDRYWGAQTQRSLQNFTIGGAESRMPVQIVRGARRRRAARGRAAG